MNYSIFFSRGSRKDATTVPNQMVEFTLPPEHFVVAAIPIVKLRTASLEGATEYRRWMSCFGAEPPVVAELWARINPEETMPPGVKAEHIMWALYFLKVYNAEEVNTQNVEGNPVEKTFRKWVWLFIEAISYQEYPVVRHVFEKRLNCRLPTN